MTTTENSLRQGTVVKKMLGKYTVRSADQAITCSLAGPLKKQLIFPIADPSSLRRHVLEVKDLDTVDPVAVGDEVTFVEAGDGSGLITEILPRKNKLSRPATDGARRFKKNRGARFTTYAHFRVHGAILDGARRERILPRPEQFPGGEFEADTPVEAAVHAVTPRPETLDEELDRRRDNAALKSALARLPEDKRRLLELHYFHDLTLEEAERIGIGDHQRGDVVVHGAAHGRNHGDLGGAAGNLRRTNGVGHILAVEADAAR